MVERAGVHIDLLDPRRPGPRHRLGEEPAAVTLPGQLRDFAILQEAGRPAWLTVGPWTHLSLDGTALRESIAFGLAHARGEPPPRAPVRLYVMGEEAWRDFGAWPPPGYLPERFHLQPGGVLDRTPPRPGGPPPSPGGPPPVLAGRHPAGTATTRPIPPPRSAACA